MSMFTREQFEEYKGNDSFLEVYYYDDEEGVELAYHYTCEDYVNFFSKFYKAKRNEL